MQAIIVKYIGPSNTKPSRLKAYCNSGSITESFSYDDGDQYKALAEKLVVKLGWEGNLTGGTLPNGDMVFIF